MKRERRDGVGVFRDVLMAADGLGGVGTGLGTAQVLPWGGVGGLHGASPCW